MAMDEKDESVGDRQCLFCNLSVHDAADDVGGSTAARSKLVEGLGCGKNEGSLTKRQLLIFFLLRKVLGLSVEFLESLLVNCGNPSEWKVKLCRLCTRLFKEADHLWDRMTRLQRDYNKITYEIKKDTIINSMSPNEIDILNENNDVAAKKAKVKAKLKSFHVTEGIRATFFIDLHAQDDDAVPQNSQIPELSTVAGQRKEPLGLRSGPIWSEIGIPYLSMTAFESKMKAIIQAEFAAAENCRKYPQKLAYLHEPEKVTSCVEEKEALKTKGVVQEWESASSPPVPNLLLTEELSSKSKVALLPPSTSASSLSTNEAEEEEEEEPLIRIVQPHTLMEPEEDQDTDAPQVTEMVKANVADFTEESVEVIDLDADEEEEDEEMMDVEEDHSSSSKDRTDPPFLNCPDIGGSHSAGDNEVQSNGMRIRKRRRKSLRVKFLKIRALSKAPKLFECSKCLSEFQTRLGCQIHIFTDHYNDKDSFHCHLCHEKFLFYHPLRQHVSEAHHTGLTAYEDEFDPETFFPAEKHNNPNDKDPAGDIFDCPLSTCSTRFPSKRALTSHCRDVHGAELSKLVKQAKVLRNPPGMDCELCSKRNIEYRAENRDILDIHMKKVHNVGNGAASISAKIKAKIAAQIGTKSLPTMAPKSKMMKCPDCTKLVANGAALAEHMKNPEIKCPLCTKHFLREEDRTKHSDREHNSFQCYFCQKSFTSQLVFEKHIANHKSLEYGQVCPVCRVRVNGQETLSRHINSAHPQLSYQQYQPPAQQTNVNVGLFGNTG